MITSARKRDAGLESCEPRVVRTSLHFAPGHLISIVLCSVYAWANSFSTFSGVSRWMYQMPKAAAATTAAVAGTKAHFQKNGLWWGAVETCLPVYGFLSDLDALT